MLMHVEFQFVIGFLNMNSIALSVLFQEVYKEFGNYTTSVPE